MVAFERFGPLRRRMSPARRGDVLAPLASVVGGGWDLTTRLAVTPGEPAEVVNELLGEVGSRLTGIAEVTVTLADATPRLTALAEGVAEAAEEQAQRAAAMADATHGMAGNVAALETLATESRSRVDGLAEVAGRLTAQSGRMGSIAATINALARQASMVAINAAVEAARLGEQGEAFAVISTEMRQLASSVVEVNQQAEDLLSELGALVGEAVGLLGSNADDDGTLMQASAQLHEAAQREAVEVQRVAAAVAEVAEVASGQAATAEQVAAEGILLGQSCDDLIVHVGRFRLRAQAAARPAVEHLAAQPAIVTGDRGAMEAAMRAMLAAEPYIQLLYATDARGRQITANIAPVGFRANYDGDGFGSDWSGRPWFTGAAQGGETYVSEVYRSVASGSYCFTVAVPLRDDRGAVVGVLGADIDLGSTLALMA